MLLLGLVLVGGKFSRTLLCFPAFFLGEYSISCLLAFNTTTGPIIIAFQKSCCLALYHLKFVDLSLGKLDKYSVIGHISKVGAP